MFGICIMAISSCKKDSNKPIESDDYLVFGHFYGLCMGEFCVLNYKLTDIALYEDLEKKYYGSTFVFSAMEYKDFELVKDLPDYFPEELLQNTNAIIGCPDCADQGGLYIEYRKNGKTQSWRIDNSKNSVPSYLHEFMDKVTEKISLLNP